MRYVPYFIGLAACLLPDARYTVANETHSTRIAGEIGGWSVLIILLLFAIVTFTNARLKRPDSPFFTGITGIYLFGFALFRAWHTFTLYSGAGKDSLAKELGASAIPGEGLFLLAISGSWLLFNAFRSRNNTFSTAVE
jgi:hypothetical protein